MKNYKNILNFSQRRLTMKTLLLFLFMFGVMGIQTMAETTAPIPASTPLPIRRIPAAPAATPTEEIPDKEWIFKANTRLKRNKRYYSEDKRYALVFQGDGNLVVYKFSAPEKFSPIWNTQTAGFHANNCVLQGDGNLVLYWDEQARWDSKSDAKNKKKKWYDVIPGTGSDPGLVGQVWMVMQSDGNLVIYTGSYPKGYALWSSGTFEKN